MTEADPTWRLDAFYQGPDDPRLEADLDHARTAAVSFRESFHGQVASLDAGQLATALQQFETLQRTLLAPCVYAQLLFAADSSEDRHRALLARVTEGAAGINEEILFFELELLHLDAARYRQLLADPAVAACRHHLDRVRATAPYTLSEEVERVLTRKDLSGREAFVQLFDEVCSALTFSFAMPGEEGPREVTGEELLGLLHHPDGAVRAGAFRTFLEGHAGQARVLTACFNNILLDHEREADLRGYPDLMTPTHLASETEPAMVKQLMDVTEANYSLAREYFDLKRRLLGLEVLKNTDIYAPVTTQTRTVPFAEARDLVLESLEDFSPEMAAVAAAFFREDRIDAAPRPGKSGGAFCMGAAPDLPVYLLLNYTGTPRDVATLAHELGHGIHYALARGQNLFHYHAPLPFAETASVFGEMLLTRRLLEREQDPAVKVALLCAKLEDVIATTFRQNVLTRFELAAHARRREGLLTAADYGDLWWQENRKLFGAAVEMIPAYRWGWSYISHFIHARFYCYSYIFGELLVLGLYRRYQQEGAAFVPAYLDLLRAGGSAPPRELLRPFAVDLDDPGFWQQGYDFAAELLEELRVLVDQTDPAPAGPCA